MEMGAVAVARWDIPLNKCVSRINSVGNRNISGWISVGNEGLVLELPPRILVPQPCGLA